MENIEKYIIKKYKDNYTNQVYKLLIDNNYYILKFFNKEKGKNNEVKISNIFYNNKYKVLEEGEKNNSFYIIRRYIAGKPLENSESLDVNLTFRIGKLLKKFHLLKNPNLDISTTENIFLKWVKKIEGFGIETKNIKKIFYKIKPLFREELTLTHMDFRLGNIILNSSLGLNIIDFEHCKFSDKYFDFVKIRRELKKGSDLWIAFKKGYNEELDEGKIDFYEFIHSVGAISYIYSNGREKNSFYLENLTYLTRYIEELDNNK